VCVRERELALHNLLHLECHSISISNLNRIGLFSTQRCKRDLENKINDCDQRRSDAPSGGVCCSVLQCVAAGGVHLSSVNSSF